MYDYFYGLQAEQFSFYRIPKVLFTDPCFRDISTEAKTLYGILMDRMNLSAKNHWIDDRGRVYIVFTIEEIVEALGCGDQKAVRLLAELDTKAGLIERKRQGLGRPNLIYVKNFISDTKVLSESQFKNCENHNSGAVNITIQESPKSQCSNTDISNTEYSDTDLFSSAVWQEEEAPSGEKRREEMRKRNTYEAYFRKTLGIEQVIQSSPGKKEILEGILNLIVDTCCANRQWILISGDRKPLEVVKSRFMKLNASHIEYVLKSLSDNTTKIRNMNQYLLAVLYNAPVTKGPYYQSWVNNDMASGLV